ncbi:unnamed protein product [Timema podura]|uniref:Uncharacterized protein n=1 Tax=Timema podura TaxID=61482 RepID=A0ABN7NMV4_TIMPD|nr:unnamed protein product [Timema podura]
MIHGVAAEFPHVTKKCPLYSSNLLYDSLSGTQCLVAIIHDDTENAEISDAMMRGRSLDSIPSTFTNDLSQRVDSVKEENLKLRSENQVLGQYIENLMSASSVFQSTSPKTKKKKKEEKCKEQGSPLKQR